MALHIVESTLSDVQLLWHFRQQTRRMRTSRTVRLMELLGTISLLVYIIRTLF